MYHLLQLTGNKEVRFLAGRGKKITEHPLNLRLNNKWLVMIEA